MNYTDAKEFLRIADMAYNAGDYRNSADITERIARCAAYDTALDESERADLTKEVMLMIGRFSDCPDEAVWEEACALSDMFRK